MHVTADDDEAGGVVVVREKAKLPARGIPFRIDLGMEPAAFASAILGYVDSANSPRDRAEDSDPLVAPDLQPREQPKFARGLLTKQVPPIAAKRCELAFRAPPGI